MFQRPIPKVDGNETNAKYENLMKQYLEGDIGMEEYDLTENDMTFELTDYVLRYWILWQNGKNKTYEPDAYEWMKPELSYTGYWSGRFFKCFSIKIPQKDVKKFHCYWKIEFFLKIFAQPIGGSSSYCIIQINYFYLPHPRSIFGTLKLVKMIMNFEFMLEI